MNILFLTLSKIESIDDGGIYTDMVRELASRGINMYVVSPREKRMNLPTELTIKENISILKVRTGNITQTNFLEKGISTFAIENQYLYALRKYFKGIKFNMIIYSTPPITFESLVKYLKNKHNSITYLILKDIFPQNAVDLNIIRKGRFIWKYFRNKEIKLYKMSDMIGCMSKGNVDYVLQHNPYLDKRKVEIFPNSIKPVEREKKIKSERIFGEYDLPNELILFVYGGNLGRPQGIDFLLLVIENFHKVDNAHLFIVGSGTEYEKIRIHIDTLNLKNVSLFNKLPKIEYNQLIEMADVGLIFLDGRFTIPNFPSRLTSYMEYSIPILASTDKITDLKEVLTESESGFWSESGDLNSFIDNAKKLSLDKSLRDRMGENGRKYLENNYDISKNVEIIIKHL